MSQSQVVVPGTRALIEKPSLAVVERPDGDAGPAGTEAEDARKARIREAAYGLYEAHGRLDGHDVDDWLAAEAALAGETSASASPNSDIARSS